MAQTPVLPSVDVFYLWPENVPAWQLFMACGTQWRTGMAGREGLDYGGLQVVMQMQGVSPRRQSQRFAEVQVMELAALKAWAEQQEATK